MIDNPETDVNGSGPNSLDKERNMMSEDPKWQGRSEPIGRALSSVTRRACFSVSFSSTCRIGKAGFFISI